jgi:hypothetical protein
LFAASVVLTGCAFQRAPDDAPIASAAARIMGGTNDANDEAVVDFIWMTGGPNYDECSGSLIAPNMILTAHHCVSSVLPAGSSGVSCETSSFAAPGPIGQMYVSTEPVLDTTNFSANAFHDVQEIVVPPGSTNTRFCGLDVALVILTDQVASPEVSTYLVPRVDSHITANEQYSAVGFGTTDGSNNAGTRRRLDDLHVKCVGTSCEDIFGTEIDPTHEWGGDHGTCEGDSGGPELDLQGRVVGVTSRGQTGCLDPIYSDVYEFGDWLKQTALHAASVGGYVAPPWATGYPTEPAYSAPVGGACGSSCATSLCLADAEGSYCTRPCEAAAPCPSGYTCTTVEEMQICARDPSSAPGTGGGASVGSSSSSGEAVRQPAAATHCSATGREAAPVSGAVVGALAALGLAAARRRRRPGREG